MDINVYSPSGVFLKHFARAFLVTCEGIEWKTKGGGLKNQMHTWRVTKRHPAGYSHFVPSAFLLADASVVLPLPPTSFRVLLGAPVHSRTTGNGYSIIHIRFVNTLGFLSGRRRERVWIMRGFGAHPRDLIAHHRIDGSARGTPVH